MDRKQSFLSLSSLSLALSLGLVGIAGPVKSVNAQGNIFAPPDRGAPPVTAGGASRSSCVVGPVSMAGLIPASGEGRTVEASPALFVYVPETSAAEAEFVLKDDNENDIARMTLPLPSQPGIVKVNLSESEAIPDLEVGRDYHWYLAAICNPQNRLDDVFAEGWLQRAEASATLPDRGQIPASLAAVDGYLQANLWHDALTTLVELRQANPGDATIAAKWEEVLSQTGLDSIAEAPLVFEKDVAAKSAK